MVAPQSKQTNMDAVCTTREWLSGIALPCQGKGRGFDPRLPLQIDTFWCHFLFVIILYISFINEKSQLMLRFLLNYLAYLQLSEIVFVLDLPLQALADFPLHEFVALPLHPFVILPLQDFSFCGVELTAFSFFLPNINSPFM